MSTIKSQKPYHPHKEDDVHIMLTHTQNDSCPEFIDISVDIIVKNQVAGKIDAVLVDRRNIAFNCFFTEMDAYSSETQWLSLLLFEPKFGRIKLKSISDDGWFNPFLYIEVFTIQPEYRNDFNSDIGSFALKKFLHHDFISYYDVSFAIYVLDGCEFVSTNEEKTILRNCREKLNSYPERMTEEEKEILNMWKVMAPVLDRIDANHFLRNGFYQDKAYAEAGGAEASILVASHCHWKLPLKSHNEATSIQFCELPQVPQGVDGELLQFIENIFIFRRFENLSMMQKEISIRKHILNGASVAGSNILHIAIMYDSLELVKILVGIEPSAINDFDDNGDTPLMTAAIICAGKNTSASKESAKTQVLKYLLTKGASRDECDSSGMTAYGKYLSVKKERHIKMQTLMGRPLISLESFLPTHPEELNIMDMLCPDDGPTESDVRGGRKNPGFINFDSDGDGYVDMSE